MADGRVPRDMGLRSTAKQAEDSLAGKAAPSFRELRSSPEGLVSAPPRGGFARLFASRGLLVLIPKMRRRL